MSAEPQAGVDRRVESRQKLSNLVTTRRETLALYTDLAQRRPFGADETVAERVQQFCEALIDYTAAAHFQLYQFLADRRERRQRVRDLADRVYPRIAATTDLILEFNDKYEAVPAAEYPRSLADDLSRLGEALADRILLEDQVIEALGGRPA